MCRVIKLFNPGSMEPVSVRDCGDIYVFETLDTVIVLNRRLGKIYVALRDLKLGFTLDASCDVINALKDTFNEKLSSLVKIYVDYMEGQL